MLYPTVQQLTNDKINRYMLVIAAAKCARHVTDLASEERQIAEAKRESDRLPGRDRDATSDSVNDKAVSVAVNRLSTGEYKIIVD